MSWFTKSFSRGTEAHKILDAESTAFGSAWSPEGKQVVFGSEREKNRQSEIFP